MNEAPCLVFFGSLIAALALIWATPNSTFAQAKGWSEQKEIRRATGMDNRSLCLRLLPGDNVYVAYRQKTINVVFQTGGKHDSTHPRPQFAVTSAPAIARGSKIILVFPARFQRMSHTLSVCIMRKAWIGQYRVTARGSLHHSRIPILPVCW